jgi:endonuclease YncB( thermonuclease family)
MPLPPNGFLRAATLLILIALALPARAAVLTGRVVAVADGDTITVLDAAKVQHKIRLAGIDAPEKGQPYGSRAKENLSRQVYGRTVTVDWQKTDRYGRVVGIVTSGGHDVNLEQVRAGLAWWYREYAREQTATDRQLYEAAEIDARHAHRGLWQDNRPVPPAEWRRARR